VSYIVELCATHFAYIYNFILFEPFCNTVCLQSSVLAGCCCGSFITSVVLKFSC